MTIFDGVAEQVLRLDLTDMVKGELSISVIEKLLAPDVIDRTYYTLLRMRANSRGQLDARCADLGALRANADLGRVPANVVAEAAAEFNAWKARNARWLTALDETIIRVQERRPAPSFEDLEQRVAELEARLQELVGAEG